MSEKDHDCSIPRADMVASCPNCYHQGEHGYHNRCLRLVEPGLWACLNCPAVYEVVEVPDKRICDNGCIRLKKREDLMYNLCALIGVEKAEPQECSSADLDDRPEEFRNPQHWVAVVESDESEFSTTIPLEDKYVNAGSAEKQVRLLLSEIRGENDIPADEELNWGVFPVTEKEYLSYIEELPNSSGVDAAQDTWF